ncbi:hypothetical protein [Neptunitalea chrysea]|nr:hypothetical protein [Neptunitalea chrysea]
MKYIIIVIFISILGGFAYGSYVKISVDDVTGDRILGLSVLAMSFILMPLFIYHRWKGKDLRNYMLTKENMDKMNNLSPNDDKKP